MWGNTTHTQACMSTPGDTAGEGAERLLGASGVLLDACDLAQRPRMGCHIAVLAVAGGGGPPAPQRLAVAARVGVRGGDPAVEPGGRHALVPGLPLGEGAAEPV